MSTQNVSTVNLTGACTIILDAVIPRHNVASVVSFGYNSKNATAYIHPAFNHITAVCSAGNEAHAVISSSNNVDVYANIKVYINDNTMFNGGTYNINADGSITITPIEVSVFNNTELSINGTVLRNSIYNTIDASAVSNMSAPPNISIFGRASVSCKSNSSSVSTVRCWTTFGADIVAIDTVYLQAISTIQHTANPYNNVNTNSAHTTILPIINKIAHSDITADHASFDGTEVWVHTFPISNITTQHISVSSIDHFIGLQLELNLTAGTNTVESGATIAPYASANIAALPTTISLGGVWANYTQSTPTHVHSSHASVMAYPWYTGECTFDTNASVSIECVAQQISSISASSNIHGATVMSNPYLDAFWVPRGITKRRIYISNNSVTHFNASAAQMFAHDADYDGAPLIYVTTSA